MDNGWLPINPPWYKKYLKWGWWRKRSYSVTYKDIGLEGIKITAGQRLRFTRSEVEESAKDRGYKTVKRINPDGSMVCWDGEKEEVISFN